VGPKRAKELLLTGQDRISGQWAGRIGLVNRMVPENKHLDEALAIASQIARIDADAVAITKQSIHRTFEIMGLGEALRANLDLIESLETPEPAIPGNHASRGA
jgi:enoyl-CoA hydratase